MKKNNLHIWLALYPHKYFPISDLEYKYSNTMNLIRKNEYLFSRGAIRQALAGLFGMNPLQIPLSAPPGKPPILDNGYGYISLSHCDGGVLIGWSKYKLGVDIECKDRNLKVKKIIQRFYSKNEILGLSNYKDNELKEKFLDLWVTKEAAIKCDRGTIAGDLAKWQICEIKNLVQNSETDIRRKIFKANINNLKLAVVYDLKIKLKEPIVCIL
jgi:phosphopantetheinyl transferase